MVYDFVNANDVGIVGIRKLFRNVGMQVLVLCGYFLKNTVFKCMTNLLLVSLNALTGMVNGLPEI